MTEEDKVQHGIPPVSPSLTEGYQAIQVGNENKGYQPTVAFPPSTPPPGGSVIALPTQTAGPSPQGSDVPTPPPGGSVIAPPTQTAGTPSQGPDAPTPPPGGSVIAAPSAPLEQK